MSRLHAALATLLALAAGRSEAQRPPKRVACAGQRVSDVQVTVVPPYHPQDGRWWETPLGILASLHTDTHPQVVRRFLLLQPGMRCDERARAESERILRAQPFLADATVRTYDDGHGGVILAVETTDELTPVLGLGTSSRSPYITALRLGDANFMGSARSVVVQWAQGDLRDTYGAHVIDYQFLGRPWHLDVSAIREELGVSGWSVDMSHPFLTDPQRVAWRVAAEHRSDVFGFLQSDAAPARVGLERRFMDLGGIVRIGPPGRLGLFGLSLSREDASVGRPPLPDSTVPYDSLLGRYRARRNVRVNALLGLRGIRFARATRFDALSAAQDVRVGIQLGAVVGRGVEALGSADQDLFLAGDLYVGAGGERTFAMLQGVVEGRRGADSSAWDGVIGSAHLALYRRLSELHTFVGTIDWGGGWRLATPFQLALGDVDGGVRGYVDSHDAGAIRGVLRLEDRRYLGRLRDQAELGVAVFADAGRVWAGDAPYGVTTPIKVGLGVGLLAALPPGSKRTWRVDVALPVSPDRHARWEIRLTTTNANRPYGREPRDVRFGRERVTPSSVFSWP